MKRGWTEAPLGAFLRWRAPDTEVSASQNYNFAGVYSHGGGVFRKHSVPGSSFGYDRLTQLRMNEFVYPKLMAWEGALGVVPENCDGCFVSPEFQVFEVDSTKLLPSFLDFYMRRPRVWSELGRLSTGTNLRRRRLNAPEFLEYSVSLPPLVEQQRLTAHLATIEKQLARIRKLREEQDHELQAALRSAFHQLETNAEWRTLSEVAPLAWRQITIDPEATYTEYGVRSFYKGIFLRRTVPGSVFSWQELYRLQTGDIVFSNIMAWEKAIAVAGSEHDGWVGNHRMLVCEPRRDMILPSCLHHYFMTTEGFARVLHASPGTAARNKTLKANDLMAIQVPVPPMSFQYAFEALCQRVAQLRAARVNHEAGLKALMPSLLDRIFSL